MANYFVIGGDNKEYGPVTDAEVRQWIAEGRLSVDSRVKAESDAEFRALGQFPEFASALQAKKSSAPPGLAPAPDADLECQAALNAVKIPAVLLQLAAGVNILLSLISIVRQVFFPQSIQEQLQKFSQNPQFQDPTIQKWLALMTGPLAIGSYIFAIVMALLIFWGAFEMQRLRNYVFAFVAALLAIIPCLTSCCLVGLPFGIWALVVLSRTEVKSQFK